MATQRIPQNYDPLVELLEDAADGAHDHEAAVGLKQNDEAALRAVLVALVGRPAGPGGVPPAAPGLKALWNTAKAEKVAATGVFRSVKSSGRAVASACVNVLKPRLGQEWSNAWQAAGFTNASLAIPENPLTLLQQLRAYFTANPQHEKADLAPGIHATAAACQTAADAVSAASSASNASNTAAGAAKKNLEDGMKAARARLSALRSELALLLGDDDDRWYAFGFDKPSDPETPEVPENVTAVPGPAGSHTLFVDWDDARRAESYRVRLVNAATNAEVDARIVEESEAVFGGLPAGVTVKVAVTSRHASGGESAASEPITAVVP